MKAEKCQVGLFLTVTVETMEKEQSLHLTDEILASILKHGTSSETPCSSLEQSPL